MNLRTNLVIFSLAAMLGVVLVTGLIATATTMTTTAYAENKCKFSDNEESSWAVKCNGDGDNRFVYSDGEGKRVGSNSESPCGKGECE
jgi:hypothetical protein